MSASRRICRKVRTDSLSGWRGANPNIILRQESSTAFQRLETKSRSISPAKNNSTWLPMFRTCSRRTMNIKANREMSLLLRGKGVAWPAVHKAFNEKIPELEHVDDCVVLRSEYERNKHLKVTDLPDRTGFECFINHFHIPFEDTRESLVHCLDYVAALECALSSTPLAGPFRVILAISDRDCTVRFHRIRPNENWIDENLEMYKSEALLVLDVPAG